MENKNIKDIELNTENEEIYKLQTEDGVEIKYRKILEFTNPENNKIYYIFTENIDMEEDEINIFPMIYIEDEKGDVRFEPIEDEKEFDMVEEVLDTLYYDSDVFE